jgi:anion-transporting  ArsA/GET3 family ATPase
VFSASAWRRKNSFLVRAIEEMPMRVLLCVLLIILGGLSGCSTMYYGAMEKLGVPKREIMVDRVKAARDSQNEAKQQFLTAMDQFKSVVNFQGGDLEKEYDKLNATLQKTEAEAADVRKRISAVEDVSQALFSEWRAEIKQYTSDTLRRLSQQKYDVAKKKYTELIEAMKRAEARLEPALAPLRDQVLFMKHNLNAKAIAGLSDELISVQTNVDKLVRDMESAIAEADAFIGSWQTE